MILEKGNCTQCGRRLIDYDLNYDNGSIKLCKDCFKEYRKEHHVIVKHCPGCVENGGDNVFYLWEGLEKFIEDNPAGEGWEYRRDPADAKDHGYIMLDAKFKTEWWVMWIVDDPEIIKEINKKLPPMKYNRG